MNGSAKRLMAVMFAAVMVASAMVVILVDERDSSAVPAETATYYYDELELDFSKTVYNAVNGRYTTDTNDFSGAGYSGTGLSVTVDVTPADRTTLMDGVAGGDEYYLSKMINKGIIAAVYDNPLVGFYISTSLPATGITHAGDYSTVAFTINIVEPFTTPLNSFKTELTTKLTEEAGAISGTPSAMVTAIHDRVVAVLTYDSAHVSASDPIASDIRSVYTALCGDHNVVCEGYAKMFKVLCDAKDIPCLIVTGVAGTSDKENHMWNYVKIVDYWYLVDCTWDDQDPMVNDYLMAGWGTEATHFGNVKIVDSHDPTGLDSGLTASDVALSYYEYGNPATQHKVTFMLDPVGDPGKVYKVQYVGDGESASVPDDPADSIGHHFFGWYQHGADVPFDFTLTIASDITLDGIWTIKDVYTLKYDTDGGTNIQATRVECDDNTTKITSSTPRKEGFNFVEWNTAKDGKGVSFKAGDDITLLGDCTLYAVWEDTTTVTYKIDSIMDKAAKFLSDETIPGVSNLLLTIGVITTVISLIAVLAIARK